METFIPFNADFRFDIAKGRIISPEITFSGPRLLID